MHDSMMMAEVGDIVNVSGSRMATPLAPPSPGSTPISTPSTMPTNIRPMFIGVRITEKPWSSAPISFMGCLAASVAADEEAQGIERARVQRHLEPQLEHQEEQRVDGQREGHAADPAVLAQDHHEQRDVDGRGHVQPEEADRQHVAD